MITRTEAQKREDSTDSNEKIRKGSEIVVECTYNTDCFNVKTVGG